MGLEPTTFCMASARDVRTRSRPFAQTACLQRLPLKQANQTDPERTPNLAILATTGSRRSARGFVFLFNPAGSTQSGASRGSNGSSG
jgi:hypothetical protein